LTVNDKALTSWGIVARHKQRLGYYGSNFNDNNILLGSRYYHVVRARVNL